MCLFGFVERARLRSSAGLVEVAVAAAGAAVHGGLAWWDIITLSSPPHRLSHDRPYVSHRVRDTDTEHTHPEAP